MNVPTPSRAASRPGFPAAGLYRIVALVTAGLVLVQAVLAGQWLCGSAIDAIRMHGWLGNAAFLGALLLVALAGIGWRRSGGGRAPLVLSLLLALLMTAQLGLGYSGRESATAAALHVPNGVLLTMVVAALVTLAYARPAGRA